MEVLVTTTEATKRPYTPREPETWKPDVVARLSVLWTDGGSAGEIAKTLNEEFTLGLTRSAVLGRVHRSALPARCKTLSERANLHHARKRMEKKANREQPNLAPPEPPPITDEMIPVEQRRQLLTLGRNECHWPVGEPGTPDFFFCGAVKFGEGPYCPAHHKRAHGYKREPMVNKPYKTMVLKVFGPTPHPADDLIHPQLAAENAA